MSTVWSRRCGKDICFTIYLALSLARLPCSLYKIPLLGLK
jgi:hypothetical protein